MVAITEPAAARALAVDLAQPLRLAADASTDWWQRNLTTGGAGGAWSQINGGGATAELFWTTPTSTTRRLTFDRLQIAVNVSVR